MKKLIPLFALILASAFSTGAFPYATSSLEIHVAEYGQYTVQVNGLEHRTTQGNLNLDRMLPGHYDIRVIRHERRGHGYGAPIHRRVIYQGSVFVPEHTRVRGRFDRRGMRFQHLGLVSHRPAPPTRAACAPAAMHPAEFGGLLASVRSTPFDRSKMEIVQTALAYNAVHTQQVAQLMREFSFDRYRLDVAKMAFDRVIDPERYHLLNQEFTFDSNARALMRYIQ